MKLKILISSLFILFCTLLTNLQFLNSGYPTRDSLHYHFNAFDYISNYFNIYHYFPYDFPAEGYVPIYLSSMSLGLHSVHKLIGMLIFIVTNNSILSWKISFIFALFIYIYGIFIISISAGNSFRYSIAISVFSLSYGVGSSYHQEQVLYTVLFLPYLYLLIKFLFQTPSLMLLIIISLLLGILSFTHFPQIQIIALIIFIYLNYNSYSFQRIMIILRLNFLIILFCFISTSILLILFLDNKNEIIYPMRIANGILSNPQSIFEFIKLNASDGSSGLSHCRSSIQCVYDFFIFPVSHIDDMVSVFVGGQLLLAIIIAFKFEMKLFYALIISIIFFIGPSLTPWGIFTYFFQFIFAEFRQWYHFFPFIFFIITLIYINSGLKISVLFSKKIFYLILFLFFTFNLFVKYTNFQFLVQYDKPNLFFDQDNINKHYRNPNLINLRKQYTLCKEKYVRVEPYQYPYITPIGFLSTSDISYNIESCLDFNNDSTKLFVFPNYNLGSINSIINFNFDEKNMPKLIDGKLNIGGVENIKILNNNIISADGWVSNSFDLDYILIKYKNNDFTLYNKCLFNPNNPNGTKIIGRSIFNCNIEFPNNHIFETKNVDVLIINNSNSYLLQKCCSATKSNRVIFVEHRYNSYFNSQTLFFDKIPREFKYFHSFYNNNFITFNGFRSLGNVIDLKINSKPELTINMQDSIYLTFYYFYLYFMQIIIFAFVLFWVFKKNK